MDDQSIISLYWMRSENAIVETSRKYGGYCYRIAYNILNNREDSEECVNDTYFKVWNSVPPTRPKLLSSFIGKITRNLALNRFKYMTAEKRGGSQVILALEELGECIPDRNVPEKIIEDRELAQAINSFLRELSPEPRKLFLQRYWALMPVKEIADLYGMSESKVKMTLMRTRAKFRDHLEKEGISF